MKIIITGFLSGLIISLLLVGCQSTLKHNFDKQIIEKIPEEIKYSKDYDGHLQGLATDFERYIFWSHTKQLVKTDLKGEILKVIDVQNHHGDLEYCQGKIYVAVNFGKFNEEPGLADSWVYVYGAKNLSFIEKYPVSEVVHGAGGIAIHNKQVMVVGGLPGNGKYNQNFVYEYDLNFNFKKRHELAGGYTYKGIQTACYFNEHWYFACYGNRGKGFIPLVLKVKQTNQNRMKLIKSFDVDLSYGMIGLKDDEFIFSNRTLDARTGKFKLSVGN